MIMIMTMTSYCVEWTGCDFVWWQRPPHHPCAASPRRGMIVVIMSHTFHGGYRIYKVPMAERPDHEMVCQVFITFYTGSKLMRDTVITDEQLIKRCCMPAGLFGQVCDIIHQSYRSVDAITGCRHAAALWPGLSKHIVCATPHAYIRMDAAWLLLCGARACVWRPCYQSDAAC